MLFSTYRRITWFVGFPLLFLVFFATWSALGGWVNGLIAGVLVVLVLIPLQLWQFARLADRMADYGGQYPLSPIFDWDLIDDDADEDGETPDEVSEEIRTGQWPLPSAPADAGPTPPPWAKDDQVICAACGECQPVERAVHCRRCGAPLARATLVRPPVPPS